MEEDKCGHKGEEDEKLPEAQLTTPPETSGTHAAAASSADEGRGRSWWVTDVPRDRTDHEPASGSSRWDFSSIPFPDLGSRERLSSCLVPPHPSLLPGSLAVGVCDVDPWRLRINLREVKMSLKEQKREEDKRRHRQDVNKDREVCSICNKMQLKNIQHAFFWYYYSGNH